MADDAGAEPFAPAPEMAASGGVGLPPAARPWFREGNVQAAVVDDFVRDGWTIRRTVNTATREVGKDIEAERDGVTLWVTVKGYPVGTAKTRPTTQARHWFSQALFDVVLWRGEDGAAQIAVALPRFSTYERLAARTNWFQHAADFSYRWVTEHGIELA